MSIELYEKLHDRELSRKKDIENGISAPIGLITLIIGLLSFFVKSEKHFTQNCVIKVVIILIIISLLTSIYYVAKSYNNLLEGFEYENLPFPNELLAYEMEISKYNEQVDESEEESFIKYLIVNYANMAEHNKILNDERGVHLHLSKKFIVFAILFSVILVLLYSLRIT